MQVLICNKFKHTEVKVVDAIPRVGDSVDVFWEPLPRVTNIIWYPRHERLRELKCDLFNKITAIVIVD